MDKTKSDNVVSLTDVINDSTGEATTKKCIRIYAFGLVLDFNYVIMGSRTFVWTNTTRKKKNRVSIHVRHSLFTGSLTSETAIRKHLRLVIPRILENLGLTFNVEIPLLTGAPQSFKLKPLYRQTEEGKTFVVTDCGNFIREMAIHLWHMALELIEHYVEYTLKHSGTKLFNVSKPPSINFSKGEIMIEIKPTLSVEEQIEQLALYCVELEKHIVRHYALTKAVDGPSLSEYKCENKDEQKHESL